jgi:hypothetical protein
MLGDPPGLRPPAPRLPGSTVCSRPVLAPQLDRFIPNRSGLDLDSAQFSLGDIKENQGGVEGDTTREESYNKLLAASLNIGEQGRILAFKHKAPAPPEGYQAGLAGLYNSNLGPAPSRKHFRHVPQTQERILDAPDLVDDYYLNLLDWSGNNVVRQQQHPQSAAHPQTRGTHKSTPRPPHPQPTPQCQQPPAHSTGNPRR